MIDKNKAQEDLKKISLKPGDRFSHYKRGGLYEIVTLAVAEDTLEPLVVYRSQDHDSVWVRTYDNFTEKVEHDGKKLRRFILKPNTSG